MQEHQNLQNKTKPTNFCSFTVAADARTPKSPKTGALKFSPASQQQMHEQNLPKKKEPHNFFLRFTVAADARTSKSLKEQSLQIIFSFTAAVDARIFLQLHSSSRCKSIQISSLLLTNLHSATKFSCVVRFFFSEFATRSGK
jgi:hypothetical protein